MSDEHPIDTGNHPLEPIRALVREISDEAKILLSGLSNHIPTSVDRLERIIIAAQRAHSILVPTVIEVGKEPERAVVDPTTVEGTAVEGEVTVGEVELGAADIDIDGGGWEEQADTNTGDAQAEPDATAEPDVTEDKPTTNPNPNARKHAAKKSRTR